MEDFRFFYFLNSGVTDLDLWPYCCGLRSPNCHINNV
jgi:hypothetical protein